MPVNTNMNCDWRAFDYSRLAAVCQGRDDILPGRDRQEEEETEEHWPRRTVTSSILLINKGTLVSLTGAWQFLLLGSNIDGALEAMLLDQEIPAARLVPIKALPNGSTDLGKTQNWHGRTKRDLMWTLCRATAPNSRAAPLRPIHYGYKNT